VRVNCELLVEANRKLYKGAKGVWGMSWRQEATKGAADCDKPGGAVKRALIPGSPNHPVLNP
jgi:hypothetical protein